MRASPAPRLCRQCRMVGSRATAGSMFVPQGFVPKLPVGLRAAGTLQDPSLLIQILSAALPHGDSAHGSGRGHRMLLPRLLRHVPHSDHVRHLESRGSACSQLPAYVWAGMDVAACALGSASARGGIVGRTQSGAYLCEYVLHVCVVTGVPTHGCLCSTDAGTCSRLAHRHSCRLAQHARLV
jgi:hypothetical protein